MTDGDADVASTDAAALAVTRPGGPIAPLLRAGWVSATSDVSLILTTITVLGLAIRLYRLDGLPAEMWGDVTTHYTLAQQVMNGHLFFDYEFGGDGPLLSYCVAVVASIAGLSFFTLKLTTVLIGTAVIVVTYFLAEELFDNRQIGLIAAFITAISFWDITFSRQAKPYILAALLAALAVTFAAKRMVVPAGIALGLGMYSQAAFWGVPVAFLLSPVALLIGAVVATPVMLSFARNPGQLTGQSSYIGEKLHTHLTVLQMMGRLIQNIGLNALAFFARGDVTFRHNIPYNPHLDYLSGVIFLVGMALIVRRIATTYDWKLLVWFVVPFLTVQIPSVLDMTPGNVPNMGRMIGAMPFAYTAIAYAIYVGANDLFSGVLAAPRAWLAGAGLVTVTLVVVFGINAYNYFVVYPRTLPNGNTPYDLAIAREVDATGSTAFSIVVSCCWGEWGQPEPDAIQDRVGPSARLLLATDTPDAITKLRTIVAHGTPVVLYLDPSLTNGRRLFTRVVAVKRQSMLRLNGWDVARVLVGVRR